MNQVRIQIQTLTSVFTPSEAPSMATSTFNPTTNIYTSPRPPISFPSDPTHSMVPFLFDRALRSYPHRPALVDAHSGETLTFLQLHSLVSSFSSALSSTLHVTKGDVVLIFAPNSVLFPVSFLSILALGAVATTVNPLYTSGELRKQALDSHAKLVITVPDLLPKSQPLNLPTVLPTVLLSPTTSPPNSNSIFLFSDLVRELSNNNPVSKHHQSVVTVSQDDTAALLYSSGTTGTSKGVVLTHRNFMATAMMMAADQDEMKEPPNTYLCFLPMFHVFGLSVVSYAQLRRGNTVVVMERFEMGKMMEAVERFRVSHLFVVPPVMVGMAKMGRECGYDLGSVRWICSGAAPLGGDVMAAVAEKFPGVEVVQGYGLTETTSIISLERPKGGVLNFGSTGHLMGGIEAKVISLDTSKPLPPNHNGELLFRGPNIMQGYFNKPEATKETLDEEGWLHTGDLGYFDEKGELYVEDRLKELIKYKGFQIAPAELEAVLTSHPEILDAAVVPLEDDEAGQVPIAYVVPRNNSLKEMDVQKFVSSQVAPFKRLRRVIFEESIPKTASGKILRRELTVKARALRKELNNKANSKL